MNGLKVFGTVLVLAGIGLFVSIPITIYKQETADSAAIDEAFDRGRMDEFRRRIEDKVDGGPSEMVGFMWRGAGAMALFFVGGFLFRLGKRQEEAATGLGPAPAARPVDDLEPWARADRTDEPDDVVKVRCRTCKALNGETAKFCDQCGAAI